MTIQAKLSVGRVIHYSLSATVLLSCLAKGGAATAQIRPALITEGAASAEISSPSEQTDTVINTSTRTPTNTVVETAPPSPPANASNSSLTNRQSAEVFAVVDDHLLGVGDAVKVEVFNIADYGGEFRVLPSGALNLPVVGLVAVEGLSLSQATNRIEQSLTPFVRRPLVTLSLLEVRPLQIAIAGEVNRPGAYQVTNDDNSGDPSAGLPTLTRAIELAGGITQLANVRQIEVTRRVPQGYVAGDVTRNVGGAQPATQSISVDLWALLKEGDLSADLRLQDGDRIIIPQATALSAEESIELASASFSPDQISVNVVGEVAAPGTVAVPPNTPLNQAILAAGGFNNRARTGVVSLVRLNPNGTATQEDIEVDFAQGINVENNPALRPNDTVIVRRSGLAQVGDTVRGLLSPITDVFRILRLF